MVRSPYLWIYYSFNSEYGRQPVDLEDMLDGLSVERAKSEIERIYTEE